MIRFFLYAKEQVLARPRICTDSPEHSLAAIVKYIIFKLLENSMMIPVAEKYIKKLKVFQCAFFLIFNYFLPVLWTELFASTEYI